MPEPRALSEAQARDHLGVSTDKWRALKKAGLVNPLPRLKSYSIKHLDALVEQDEEELERRNNTAGGGNVIILHNEGDSKKGREVHDPCEGERAAKTRVRPHRRRVPKESTGSTGGSYPDLV